jgi:hypothetical protein
MVHVADEGPGVTMQGSEEICNYAWTPSAWTNDVPFPVPHLCSFCRKNRTLHHTWRFTQFWLGSFVRHLTRSAKEYVPCKHHHPPSTHAPLTFQLNPPMIIRILARYIAFVWMVAVTTRVSLDYQSLLGRPKMEDWFWGYTLFDAV